MYWRNLTREEIAKINKKTPVLLPLAAIEQHGEHLPVDTDLRINEYFCQQLEKKISTKILIAPAVAVTCSGHHSDFAGTLTVSHKVLFDYVTEIICSILQQGFSKVLLFNSHGGNQAIGQAIIEHLGLRYPKAHLLMISWWKIANKDLKKISEAGFGGTGHACELETSLVAAANPQLIKKDKIKNTGLSPMPEWAKGDLLHSPNVHYHRTMREFTKDGVFGNPELFSVLKGKKVTSAVIKALKKIIEDIHNW